MFPMYRYMDSKPHQGGNYMPFPQYCQPNVEALPPQMMVDPSKCQSMHGSWPYSGSYGYPVACHTCCNHNSRSGYWSFRPACHHLTNPHPCCGSYPPFPQPQGYSVQYFPPPYYTMELPRYEYDKNMPDEYHCCGCPHHKSNQKQEKDVRIEEEEQDAGQKGNGTLVPIQLKNYPYPVMLLPQQYMNDKGYRSETGKQDENSPRRRPLENAFQVKPRIQEKGSLFDINSFKSLTQDEEGKNSQNQGSEEDNRQFPFPVIWVPAPVKQEVAQKADGETNEPKYSRVPPLGFKPVLPKESSGSINIDPSAEPKGDDELVPNKEDLCIPDGSEATNKTANPKSIPVKHVRPEKDKMDVAGRKNEEKNVAAEPVDGAGRSKDLAVKQSEDHQMPKSPDADREPSMSPPKSKFSPICPRVDPLPKKKNGNGSSRSPSPPAREENLNDKSNASSSSGKKGTVEQKVESSEGSPGKSKEAQPEKEKRAIKVTEGSQGTTNENEDENLTGEPIIQVPVQLPVGDQDPRKSEKVGKAVDKFESKKDIREIGKGGMKQVLEPVKRNKEKSARKSLSDAEAATLIQSAYRGFSVRRWEPLKKLRQIAEIRERLEEVKREVDALESLSGIQRGDKQRVVIGEQIMSLLLKLDTIQGLHPILRDIRKSLARDLVILQEKLDSIITKLEKSAEEESSPNLVENGNMGTPKNVCTEKWEGKAQGPMVNLSENKHGDASPSSEQENGETPPVNDPSGSQRGAFVNLDKEDCGVLEHTIVQAPTDVELSVGQPEPIVEREDAVANEQGVGEEILPKVQKQVNDCFQSRQNIKLSLVEDIAASDVTESSKFPNNEINIAPSGEEKIQLPDNVVPNSMSFLEELPVGILEDEPTVYDPKEGSQSNVTEAEAQHAGDKDISPMDFAEELPVGALKDEPVIYDLSKDDQTGNKEAEARHASEEEVHLMTNEPPSEVDSRDADLLHELPYGVIGDDSVSYDLEDHQKDETGRNEDNMTNGQQVQEVAGDEGLSIKGGVELKPEQMQGLEACSVTEQPMAVVDAEKVDLVIIQERDKQDDVQHAMPLLEENKNGKAEVSLRAVNSDCAAGEEKNADETGKEEVVARTEVNPSHLEPNEDRQNLTAENVITGEHNRTLDISERKLVEENEKMREMIEKLLQSGKNQLNVINDLTGRVKALEKKLAAKKQKAKRRRFRTAGSGSLCARPRNGRRDDRAVNVAV